MRLNKMYFLVLVGCIFAFCAIGECFPQNGNNTVISGTVTDASTGEPIPSVTVVLENTTIGTTTDDKGHYRITTFATSYKIDFSFIGYERQSRIIYPGTIQKIDVLMYPSTFELNEVVVKPSNKSYHNRDNPAVELIKKVIDHKDKNRDPALEYYSCKRYEKIAFIPQ